MDFTSLLYDIFYSLTMPLFGFLNDSKLEPQFWISSIAGVVVAMTTVRYSIPKSEYLAYVAGIPSGFFGYYSVLVAFSAYSTDLGRLFDALPWWFVLAYLCIGPSCIAVATGLVLGFIWRTSVSPSKE